MINTIVCGFYDKWNATAITNLEQDKVIKICKWVIADDVNPVQHENVVFWWDIVFEKKYASSYSLSTIELEDLKPYFHIMEQQMVREKLFEMEPAYEVHNVLIKFLEYLKQVIIEKQVQLIIFSDIPHGAYNYIFYHLAHCMGVKTIMCMPSFWTGRAYVLGNLEDIGLLSDENNSSIVEEKIEKKFQKVLPYMHKATTYEKIKQKAKLFWNFSSVIEDKRDTSRRNFRNYGSWNRYFFTHLQRFSKRYIENVEYRNNYKKYFCEMIHENEKFVYFPLHLQPEMTTDSLGGEYYDQLLAVEHLRAILPRDWFIYVKENPKQDAYMRGRAFFDRLTSVANVRLLSKDVNTYELIEKCQFVATITGTAGWEAITGGKTALVFGLAWYRNLPGAFAFHEGMDVAQLLNFQYDKELLEKQTALLKATTFEMSLSEYEYSLLGIDSEINIINIYCALKKKIEAIG